jgi:hypothetical protein
MTPPRARDRDWFTSSRSSDNANCVEVRFTGGEVGVRDSKDQGGATLTFAGESWTRFVGLIKTAP